MQKIQCLNEILRLIEEPSFSMIDLNLFDNLKTDKFFFLLTVKINGNILMHAAKDI